jgi:hypothetical protein
MPSHNHSFLMSSEKYTPKKYTDDIRTPYDDQQANLHHLPKEPSVKQTPHSFRLLCTSRWPDD